MNLRQAPLAAGLATASLVLAACLPSLRQVSPDDSSPWPGAAPEASWNGDYADLPVYHQDLTWKNCGGLECATIQVPLDWSDPAGATISLALNRAVAGNPDERIGSLLFNPGGPGAAGLSYTAGFAMYLDTRLTDRYDLVGFDPRGVGESSPLNCGTDAELDAYYLSDEVIETQEDLDAARQKTADFAQRCLELTGSLIKNVDTVSAARDMDVIRAAVGDEKFHYLGFSYGTQLGAVYAELFPEKVGRMVLDGVLDFLLPPDDITLGQAAGFEHALEAYIESCVASSDCPLGRDAGLAKRKIQDMMTEARNVGIPTASEDLNGTLLVYGVVNPLYAEFLWPSLTDALAEVVDRGTGRAFLENADEYLERSKAGAWLTNSQEANTAINCIDTPSRPLMTIAEFRDFEDRAKVASPTLGWWFGSGAGCEGWPWTAKEQITDLTAAAGAGPLLLLGTTGDPATPYAWAQSLAARLPNATLLTYVGEGHTAYPLNSPCIDDAVNTYLVDGTVPASGTTC